ncbi:MAG: hypothetical protein AB8E15_01520 [Bdellovibrionales bacterium]
MAEIEFFKSKDSIFVSGTESLEKLQKNIQSKEDLNYLKVDYLGNHYHIPESSALQLQNFVAFIDCPKGTPMYPRSIEQLNLAESCGGKIYQVYEFKNGFYKIHTGNKYLWIKEIDVKPEFTRGYYAYFQEKTRLKRNRFSPIHLEKGARVLIYKKKGKNLWFKKRNYVYKENENSFLHPGLIDYKIKRAIIKSDSLLLSSRQESLRNEYIQKPIVLDIHSREKRTWYQSYIAKHGRVFWISKPISKKSYRLEDLLKKDVYDMGSSPVSSKIKFVAADGIYASYNGIDFKKLGRFNNLNLPIEFSKNGNLFIGNLVSFNQGKDFKSIFSWTDIHNKIGNRLVGKKLLYHSLRAKDTTGKNLHLVVKDRQHQFHFNVNNFGRELSLTKKVSL